MPEPVRLGLLNINLCCIKLYCSYELRIRVIKSRYIAGMGPATQKYNGAKITRTGHKTKIPMCEENNFDLD